LALSLFFIAEQAEHDERSIWREVVTALDPWVGSRIWGGEGKYRVYRIWDVSRESYIFISINSGHRHENAPGDNFHHHALPSKVQ